MVVLQRTHPPGRQMYLRTGAFLSRVLVDGSIVRLEPNGRRRRLHRGVWCYVEIHGAVAYLLSLREGIIHDLGTIYDATVAKGWARARTHHGVGARRIFVATAPGRACIGEAPRQVSPLRRWSAT